MLIAKSIERCGEVNIKLSVELCQRVLSWLVNHCKWNQSYGVCMYMIANNLSFYSTIHGLDGHVSGSLSSVLSSSSSSVDKAVFFTLGALLQDSQGLEKALQLVAAVAQHRRHDLAMLCNFSKAGQHFSFLRSSSAAPLLSPQALSQLQAAMEAHLSALRTDGWLSLPALKLLLAVAVGARQTALAEDFSRKAVAAAVELNQRLLQRARGVFQWQGQDVDVLALLRALSQGDARAEGRSGEQSARNATPQVTVALLSLLVQHMQAGWGSEKWREGGVLRLQEACCSYWVLAARCRHAHLALHLRGEAEEAAVALLEVDRPAKLLLRRLGDFAADQRRTTDLFPDSTPFERRLVRVLCDHLGLQHAVRASSGDAEVYFLKVWKAPSPGPVPVPSYEELLRWDLRLSEQAGGWVQPRRLDGLPLYWPYLRGLLLLLDDLTLVGVTRKVVHSMRAHPSASWGLLWVQLLVERGLPLPGGCLRSLLGAAAAANDLYALLEVLLLAQQEPLRARATSYQRKLRAVRDDGDTSTGPMDSLEPSDWARACVAVLRAQGSADLPREAFHQAFTEVMALMKACGASLDPVALGALLRYLVGAACEPHPPAGTTASLHGVLQRMMARRRSLPLSHVEPAALSHLLLSTRVLPARRLLALARPLYRGLHYLPVPPHTLAKLVEALAARASVVGGAFLADLDLQRRQLHHSQGRKDFYGALRALVEGNPNLAGADLASESARDAVAQMCIYAAYLVGSRDGEYRQAFELLYLVEMLYREAEEGSQRNFRGPHKEKSIKREEEEWEDEEEEEEEQEDYIDDDEDDRRRNSRKRY